jgi:hypothetical protein
MPSTAAVATTSQIIPMMATSDGDGYCASVERGAGSGERGFLIFIFKNSDNHGEGDLLPWIMKLWIFFNSWI